MFNRQPRVRVFRVFIDLYNWYFPFVFLHIYIYCCKSINRNIIYYLFTINNRQFGLTFSGGTRIIFHDSKWHSLAPNRSSKVFYECHLRAGSALGVSSNQPFLIIDMCFFSQPPQEMGSIHYMAPRTCGINWWHMMASWFPVVSTSWGGGVWWPANLIGTGCLVQESQRCPQQFGEWFPP